MGRPSVTPCRIAYVSGTRADFGLMRRALLAIQADKGFTVEVAATGMHLDADYGHTVDEIVASGLPVGMRVPNASGPRDGLATVCAMSQTMQGFAAHWSAHRPDTVLLLGDRAEMLAGALAAAHLAIHTIHVHGGERSGTLDEPIRHAISKLATRHWVATQDSRQRLMRMGEQAERIDVVGAPGLDGLAADAHAGQGDLISQFGEFWDLTQPWVLALMHPEGHDPTAAHAQTTALLVALQQLNLPVLWLWPNADAGSAGVLNALQTMGKRSHIHVVRHLPRPAFCAAMASASVLVGNSSSGVIEAASFSTPALNLGLRQRLRQRSANVQDAPWEAAAIFEGLQNCISTGKPAVTNVYGDGQATARMLASLREWQAAPASWQLEKFNAY